MRPEPEALARIGSPFSPRGDPLAEFEKLWRQRWDDIENFLNVAKFGARWAACNPFCNDTNERFLSKRHNHARAWLNFGGKTLRDFVGERGAQRDSDRHVAKFLAH